MSTRMNKGVLGLLAGAVTTALLLGGAPAAHADPANPDTGLAEFRAVNGTGSDTTQDLNNGLAAVVTNAAGDLVLGSYDATVPDGDDNYIQTRQCGSWIPRPNGSGQGVAALKAAKGSLTLTNARGTSKTDNAPCGGAPGAEDTNGPLTPNDIQFARSSSGVPASTSGAYAYVPLAVDAVTYAVHSSNTTLPRNLTKSDLTDIYSAANGATVALDSGASVTVGLAGTGADVVPFIPQSGSGTRSFWLSALGLTETTKGTAVADTYNGGTLVQEHDGSVLAAVSNAIVPFSIAQHIAQGNSTALQNRYNVTVTDRRNGAQLATVDGVAPLDGGELNTAFPLARAVFTVVQHAEISTNANLSGAFVGTGARSVYQATSGVGTFVIEDFGFGSIINRDTGVNGVTVGGNSYQAGDASSYRID